MADVSIDSTVVTHTARGLRSVVFTTTSIGYWFYYDSTGAFVYSKTTDGGATWGAAVTVSSATTGRAFDVWFDKRTPGDSGTLIHTVFMDTTSDDALYRTLDTNGDVLGTQRQIFAGVTCVTDRGNFISVTKALNGYLYCAYDLDAGVEKGFHRSTDGGVTWSASLDATFVEATIDVCLLFPAANTGDGADCLALYHDASADALTLKLWDSSGAATSESATIQTHIENITDLTGQIGFSASIRHSDGKIICAAVSERDTVTADHGVFELNCTGPATFTVTPLTAITTNIDDHYYPALFIDQTTNNLYVAFNGLRDGTEVLGTTTKIYYTKSTDGGTSWSAGSTAYQEGATAAAFQVWAPLMGPRFYVGWRVGTTLVGNAVNSVTFSAPQASDDLAIRFGSLDAITGTGLVTTLFTTSAPPAVVSGGSYYLRRRLDDWTTNLEDV